MILPRQLLIASTAAEMLCPFVDAEEFPAMAHQAADQSKRAAKQLLRERWRRRGCRGFHRLIH